MKALFFHSSNIIVFVDFVRVKFNSPILSFDAGPRGDCFAGSDPSFGRDRYRAFNVGHAYFDICNCYIHYIDYELRVK